jgi:hypothetical protein
MKVNRTARFQRPLAAPRHRVPAWIQSQAPAPAPNHAALVALRRDFRAAQACKPEQSARRAESLEQQISQRLEARRTATNFRAMLATLTVTAILLALLWVIHQ